MSLKNTKNDDINSPDADLEYRVDEMMAVERDDRHPSNRGKSFDDVLVKKPNLPMKDGEFDVKIIREGGGEDDTDVFLSESRPSQEASTDQQSVNDKSYPANTSSEKDPEKEAEAILSSETDEAVDGLTLSETSKALDEPTERNAPSRLQQLFQGTLKTCKAWWQDKKKRNGTLIVIAAFLLTVAIIPATRYWLLNSLGVRVSTSLVVIDNSTTQPLRNVEVSIDDITTRTNEEGFAQLDGVRLGRHELIIQRSAFAPRNLGVTLGWGSNPLGQQWLYPTGAQYAFVVDDYVSGEPIEKAEVISSEASAFSNEDGLALLTTDVDADTTELDVVIQVSGYRDETVTIDVGESGQQGVRLVPELRHFFVDETEEGYQVVASHIDGQNQTIVLPATGNEREDMVLLPHPTKDRIAVVSTRDGQRNDDGFLLSTLTIIDLDDNERIDVAQSERLQLVGWFDDRLVFIRIAAGASGMDPSRHRLMSYNYLLGNELQLASGNYFNAIARVNDFIYFAPSSIFRMESTSLKRIRADGTSEEVVMERESWSIYRKSFETLTVATSDKWFEYDIFRGERSELDDGPEDFSSKLFIANPWRDSEQAVIFIGEMESQLMVYNSDNQAYEKTWKEAGLGYPLRWLNETTLAYRLTTESETADYAVSTRGGQPIKIKNVSKSSSIERWFSY